MQRGHRIRRNRTNTRGRGRGGLARRGRRGGGQRTSKQESGEQGRGEQGRGERGRGQGRRRGRRGSTSSTDIPNAIVVDHFPSFDPHQDVKMGMFVAMETEDADREKGIPFFVAKVISLNQQACEDGTIEVLWY